MSDITEASLGLYHKLQGDLFFNGEIYPVNYDFAIHHYTESAKYGNTSAKNMLGFIYNKGIGVHKNINASISWFSSAIIDGDTIAIYNLAKIYEHYHKKKYLELLINYIEKAGTQTISTDEYILYLNYKFKNMKQI